MSKNTVAPTPSMKDIHSTQSSLRFIRLPEKICTLTEVNRLRLLRQPLRLVPFSHDLYPAQQVLLQWLGEHVQHYELSCLCKKLASCDKRAWDYYRIQLYFNGFELFPNSIDVM